MSHQHGYLVSMMHCQRQPPCHTAWPRMDYPQASAHPRMTSCGHCRVHAFKGTSTLRFPSRVPTSGLNMGPCWAAHGDYRLAHGLPDTSMPTYSEIRYNLSLVSIAVTGWPSHGLPSAYGWLGPLHVSYLRASLSRQQLAPHCAVRLWHHHRMVAVRLQGHCSCTQSQRV